MVAAFTTIFILFLAIAFSVSTIIYVVIDSAIEKHGGHGDSRRDDNSFDRSSGDLDTRLHRQARTHQQHVNGKTRVKKEECSSFYETVCTSRNGLDVFATIRQENAQRIKSIVGSAPQLKEFTTLCNRKTTFQTPIINDLLSTVQPRSYDDLAYVWGRLHLYGVVTPLNLVFVVDPWNATRRIPSLRQSGVFDYEYEVSGREHRDFVARIFDGDDRLWVDSIINIERALYGIFESSGDDDNDDGNLLFYLDERGLTDIVDDWQSLVSDRRFNITHFLRGCRPSTTITENEWCTHIFSVPLWCRVQRYLAKLPLVVLRFTLETWVAYTRFAVLASGVRYHNVVNVYPHQYDVQLELQASDHRFEENSDISCSELALTYLPDVVDREYRVRYIDDVFMNRIQSVAEHVRRVYIATVVDAWQREKLRTVVFAFEVSAPERPPVHGSSFSELLLKLKHARFIEDFLAFYESTSIDYVEGVAVQTSAYYQQQTHKLVLSLGLLQSPFLSADASDAFFYARLGVVVAHELSHAIDFVGTNFDVNGTYRPVRENSTLAECLEKRYTTTTALGNRHDGRKTLNENFADAQGLNIAYMAFLDLAERSDEERRQFFTAYAQQFCRRSAKTKQLEYEQLRRSVHSLPQYRVDNAVATIDDYSTIWGCSKIDGCL